MELLRSIALKDKVWETISEDGSCGKDEYWPDMENMYIIALLDEDTLHGFLLSRVMNDSVSDIHIVIDPDLWGNSKNVELTKLGCQHLFNLCPRMLKIIAMFPVTDAPVLRFAQRVGFQREGVNKASFLRKGVLLDQYYVGLKRH